LPFFEELDIYLILVGLKKNSITLNKGIKCYTVKVKKNFLKIIKSCYIKSN
jgi:hypothetical protein